MELLTPDEVAGILKVKTATVKKWLREGTLKGIKIGGVWRIKQEDLDTLLNTK